MASRVLSVDEIFRYFKENGGKVKNKEVVRHFRKLLTDPVTKDENRKKFKEYVNFLAHTKNEGDDKVLILKNKFLHTSELSLDSFSVSTSSINSSPVPYDPRNEIGIPTSPPGSCNDIYGETPPSTPPRQPPPYRNPPPVVSPSPSIDSISFSSASDDRPQAPPRRRGVLEMNKGDLSPNLLETDGNMGSTMELRKEYQSADEDEKEVLSVKERTQQFNRMASVEDELSPRITRSAEKDKSKNRGAEEDASTLSPLEPKKCQEWYVTASRGDYQELLKLARAEPRLVNKKDPFTAYTVLHWGAKYGNPEIIKIFAGKYKVDVNGRTNGGYTPLHISAQFGHENIFKLLIEVYKADPKIRDYSGRTAEYYIISKRQKENNGITLRSEYNINSNDSKYHTYGRADKKSKSFRKKVISSPTVIQRGTQPALSLFQTYPTYPGLSK